MEPPPVAKSQFISQNSSSQTNRMRILSGEGDVFTDPEVIEIPPPVFQTPKNRKQKKVILPEVIDLDKDENSSHVVLLDEIVKTGNKGKAIKNDSDGFGSYQPKECSKSSVSGSHSIINLDFYDDQHVNVVDDFMDVEDFTILQAYFDSVNIPAGVEAPVPWLVDPSLRKEKMVNRSNSVYVKPASASSSSLQKKMDVLGHPAKMDLSSSLLHPQSANSKNAGALQDVGNSAQKLSFHVNASNPPWLGEKSDSNVMPAASGISTNNNYVNQFDPMTNSHGVGPSLLNYGTADLVQNQVGTDNLFYSGMPTLKNTLNYPPGVGSFMPWMHESLNAEQNLTLANYTTHPSFYDPFDAVHMPPEEPTDTSSGQDCSKNKEIIDEDDILRKYNLFKKFDAIEDHLDHHYASKASSLKQPPNKWVKRIQEEWKILENDLPDAIFVRVYESRMDLLRAVIVGAEGTPYHDGLFFFDVFFPNGYPNEPPHVYYHSGGLRLNPNLYNCGKVCLSLLNTWTGDMNEKWIPSMSTMLQVLVSIQALILNEKPYFNEPGYASWDGTPHGEMESHKYNESTFILSLKTMLYTVRKPPKHFKDLVMGHFYKRAYGILGACKAYRDGAEVGCLVEGGVQNIHKGIKGCTPHFRISVAGHVDRLIKEFMRIGIKDCEKFLTQAKGGVDVVDNNTKTRNNGFH